MTYSYRQVYYSLPTQELALRRKANSWVLLSNLSLGRK